MKFEEKRVGDYCVYTGAVEALCTETCQATDRRKRCFATNACRAGTAGPPIARH
jgi:hypothetical protein